MKISLSANYREAGRIISMTNKETESEEARTCPDISLNQSFELKHSLSLCKDLRFKILLKRKCHSFKESFPTSPCWSLRIEAAFCARKEWRDLQVGSGWKRAGGCPERWVPRG